VTGSALAGRLDVNGLLVSATSAGLLAARPEGIFSNGRPHSLHHYTRLSRVAMLRAWIAPAPPSKMETHTGEEHQSWLDALVR